MANPEKPVIDSADAANAGPAIHYSESGRSGTIHYRSQESSFDMWYELAMPPALVIIGIPEPRPWEAQTNTPVSQRAAILQWIGKQVINDKLSGDGYSLSNDNILTIYKGKNPDTDH